MISFLYRSGSEETQKILLREISQDLSEQKKAVLLVPEQETVNVERRMAENLPPEFQLRFEVLNFTRLANRVFRAVGGLSYRYASPSVCALTMWRTLQKLSPVLSQYGGAAGADVRLCDKMLSAVAQFKACCVDPELLAQTADLLDNSDPLKGKLTDLSLLLTDYGTSLRENYDDAADDLSQLSEVLPRHGEIFSDTCFYLDSFTDFTAQEFEIIRLLCRFSIGVTVVLPMKSAKDSGIHLSAVTDTQQRLIRMARENGQRIFFENPPEVKAADSLSYLKEHLFDMNAEPAPLSFFTDGGFTLFSCPTPYAEAEHCAAVIRSLIQGGCRYRDITVVVRDLPSYSGILDAALEKEGIPYFLSEKTDITVRPLIKLVLTILRIRIYNWQSEDVLGVLKTGLFGISPDDINLFEDYIGTWHLRGSHAYAVPFQMNPDGYRERLTARGEKIRAAANRVREALFTSLFSLFGAFDKAENITDLCRALYNFLSERKVPDTLRAQAAQKLAGGDRRDAEELSRLFGVFLDVMESVCEIMGKEPADPAALSDAFRVAFSHTDIGTIPTSADEVTVGSAAMLRADRPLYAFILGLNEGIFPKTVQDTGILGDAEKRRLSALGITLSKNSTVCASEELFYVNRAFGLPKKKLFLSFSAERADGKAATPSFAISRLDALFPKFPIINYETENPLSRIYSENSALENYRDLDENGKAAVRALLEERGSAKRCCLNVPVTDTAASISPETAQTVFGASSFNPTGLERFAACKFSYYCKNILRLREEARDTLGVDSAGTFLHFVFEQVLGRVRKDGRDYKSYGKEEINALAKNAISAFRDQLSEIGGTVSPRAEALLDRLGELSSLVTGALFSEFSESRFTPALFELNLSALGRTASVLLPEGRRIPLSGKVDRVDYLPGNGKEIFLRVVDYKSGTKEFKPEDIKDGFSLQMPLYLYALCHGAQPMLAESLGVPPDTVFRPAGISYFSTNIGTDTTAGIEAESTALEKATDRLKKSGIRLREDDLPEGSCDGGLGKNTEKAVSTDGFEEIFKSLCNTVSRLSGEMLRGDAEILPHADGNGAPCRFCSFRAICRSTDSGKEKR